MANSEDSPPTSPVTSFVGLSGSTPDLKKTTGKVVVGMICEKKDLYQKIDRHNKATWTADMPNDLDEAAEDAETEKYALLVRNKKSYDSRKKLEIDSIVIQSPLLKNVLRDILKDYPGVTTSLSRLTFNAPFKPFVHRWQQLLAALDGDYDDMTKGHLALLKSILYEELKDIFIATEDYAKHQVVTYEHIWTIFQPGSVVYASRLGKPVAVRLVDGQFSQHQQLGPCFYLRCDRIDWDGSRFGYDVSSHFITPFEGTTSITSLECFPLSYHPNKDDVMKKLLARGGRFEKLAGHHYKSYRGRAMKITHQNSSVVTIDDRIIIDATAYNNAHVAPRLYLRSLDHATPNTQASKNYDEGSDEDYDGDSDEECFWDGPRHQLDDFDSITKRRRPLKEEELLLCTPIVRGYALRAKAWLQFFIDSVNEIVFNDSAFDSLVLPEGHKSLIFAIAQAQVKKKDDFDDVIAGKGRGVIMLLSGGPGIGKTLTAESVAEQMRVPLYTMSAGDLGATSVEVESSLTRILSMVAKWKAVLLLDECDVFLEARSVHDLDRNRIVSIFLRTLEYYEGLLFLTTNRVKNMDEAFNSRIHFRLQYPELDAGARRTVWAGFLDRHQGGHDVSDENLSRLEKLEMNGRVIKNVLKSATLLASHKDEKLTFQHIELVLKIDGYEI
ncbi:putative TOB3 [Rosellinia necatrix]|uniref:Putative TOB3 n=1 Tax=Rosellinia necatrix TaxID=77044 RepID=A0A1S7UL68_ROSNE|nr:putative TOB3 [Rosellinia necatrix]